MRKFSMTTVVVSALVLSAGTAHRAHAQGLFASQLNLCIEPVGTWDGAQIVQNYCNSSDNAQYWGPASVPAANGFHIVNWATGKCLDDTDGSTADWTPVQQWTCSNTGTSELWRWGPG